MLSAFIGFIIGWLYCAILESSNWQATIGKRAVGIYVTDVNRNRITFGRATGRNFAKIVSWIILCIGYFMAGWTLKKQALHDMLAGTLVLRKQP
ncbi:MAG: RDD family protein [Calditrichaeota bacterium]|nr:RDD family protein [Calditrichota bacterium]